MNKIITVTGKFVLSFFFVLILLGTSIFIIGRMYKEELKNYIIKEINRSINVRIQVKSVDISTFRKFPFVSVVLTDATAWSASGFEKDQFKNINTDTLFSASRIYLQFSLIDIIHNNYRLRRAHALNGNVLLLTDRFGQINYRLFKEQKKISQNPVSVNLDNLKISGIKWTYLNLSKNIYGAGYIKDIVMKGKFANSDHTLSLAGSLMVDSISRNKIRYADQLNASLKVNMTVNDSLFNISKGELSLNKMDFQLTGSLTHGERTNLDLQIGADRIDIKSLLLTLPVEFKLFEKHYPIGSVEFLAKISGYLSRTDVPNIRAAFNILNAKIFLSNKNLSIERLNLKGTYSNGTMHNAKSSSIKVTEYSFISGKTYLQGRLTIDNFMQPYIIGAVTGQLDAHDFSEIVSIPGIKIYNGIIQTEITLNARLSELKEIHLNKIMASGITGKFTLDSLSGDFPGLHERIDYLSGTIRVDGDKWYPELRGKSNESDIRINIEADHVLGYLLFKKTSLWLRGDLYSHFLDLKKFIYTSGKDTTKFFFPKKLYFLFNYATDSLEYGKFKAKNINSILNYTDGILTVSSLEMNTLKGRIKASGVVMQKVNGEMIIKNQSHLERMDINDLFYTFNDFGQKFIVSENLKGLISGNIDMRIITNNNFEPFYSTLSLNSDVIISNGELIDFEPIKELSRYIELSELEHITFSSLQNSIIIKDSKVFIPKMDIHSSAFNITTSGIHGFDNYFEYKVKVSLSELLAGKARKEKNENNEFGVVEDDGSGGMNLYLSITGTPDKYLVRYDKKEAMNDIRNNLQNEKKVIKTILKEEFRLFKRDTVGNLQKKIKSDEKFIMDWGEENGSETNELKKKNKEEKTDIIIEW